MVLFLLACSAGKPGGDTSDPLDTSAIDTSDTFDTSDTSDTGLPASAGPLDACVVAGRQLSVDWEWSDDEGGAVTGLDWREGRAVALVSTHVLVALDAPADGTEPVVLQRQSMEIGWDDQVFAGGDVVQIVGGSGLARWDTATDALEMSAWPSEGTPGFVSPDPGGLAAASAEAWLGIDAGGSTTGTIETGLDRITAIAGDADHRWVAGLVGEDPYVVLGGPDGTGVPVAVPLVFGEPTAIALLPGGRVHVAGGPAAYGWIAVFAADGTLEASSQFKAPGLPRLVGSLGSAYSWGFFNGMAGIALGDDTWFDWMFDATDLTDLYVDPTGGWLLAGREGGRITRYSCPAE